MIVGQDSKVIEIRKAGSSNQNELLYPGANLLLKDKNTRVNLYHEGALIISDKAFFTIQLEGEEPFLLYDYRGENQGELLSFEIPENVSNVRDFAL